MNLIYIGPDEYYTDAENIWPWEKGGHRFRVVQYPGFQTDIASVPGLLGISKMLGFEKDGPHRRAAVLHDFLYYVIKQHDGEIPDHKGRYQLLIDEEWTDLTSVWKRKQADQMFLHFMLLDGVPKWKAQIMYRAVRTFGGLHSRLG